MRNIEQSICAVVPVYNAQSTLTELVQRLDEVLSCFEKHSIILVDDGSTDGSNHIMKELYCKYESVTAVTLEGNFGQQSAVLCGLRLCGCDYAVIIDDDLEQDPADMITLYDELKKGYDVVYGVNFVGGGEKGLLRRLGSRMRDSLFDRITHKPKDVKVCSFRIMSRAVVLKVIEADTRFVYISFEILKHTRSIKSVSVKYNRPAQSQYSFAKLAKLLLKMYVYYSPGPLKRLCKKGECYKIKEILTRESSS